MVPGSSSPLPKAVTLPGPLESEARAVIALPQASLVPARVRSLLLNLAATADALQGRVSALESKE